MPGDGILSGPVDLDGPRRPPVSFPEVAATPGVVVEHRLSGVVGSVVSCTTEAVVLRDRAHAQRPIRLLPGAFLFEGRPCTLVPPTPSPAQARRVTASGSVAPAAREARVARASRILVEGRHDAELLERVWGDDLREAAVVVELLDGMDHLDSAVASFGPAPQRRLGILLDHLVDGSKEARAAAAVRSPNVLVTGTPFVDVWAAVRPAVVGLERWPDVPHGQPWKEGVLAALGIDRSPGEFWRDLLGRVATYRDLEPALVGAVEQLIDFVTEVPE